MPFIKRQEEANSNPVISPELMRKVRLLELRTRLQVRDVFSGRYHSIFKGQGMDFAEVREYIPGDDVRTIDWNVSARMGHPYVKIYREERELTVLLLVDVSASGEFGTQTVLKREIAAELTALLTLAAMANNDKVGLLLFTDRIEHFVAPKKGRRHALRLIRDVLAHRAESPHTSIAGAVEYALKALRKRAALFLISDFIDTGYERAVRVAGRKHDLIAVELSDPRERELPDVGLAPLRDAEIGNLMWINTSSRRLRQDFKRETERQVRQREAFFKQIQVDRIELSVDKPYIMELIKFFRMRERRK